MNVLVLTFLLVFMLSIFTAVAYVIYNIYCPDGGDENLMGVAHS